MKFIATWLICLTVIAAASVSVMYLLILVGVGRGLALVVASGVLAVFIHETGHFLMALAMRMHVRQVFVCGLRFEYMNGRLRIGTGSGWCIGYVSADRPTGERKTSRMVLYIVAGPAASLVASVLFLMAAWFVNSSGQSVEAGWIIPNQQNHSIDGYVFRPKSFLVVALTWLGFLNLITGIGSLLPTRGAAIHSDGYQLLSYLTGDAAERMDLVDRLVRDSRAGRRPRDWDPVALDRLGELTWATNADQVTCHLFRYYRLLDSGQVTDAALMIDAAVVCAKDGRGRMIWPSVAYEAAYFAAAHRRDLAATKTLLAQAQGQPGLEPQTQLRAEAALCLVEGRFADAIEKADQVLALLSKSDDRGGSVGEGEWIEQIRHSATCSLNPDGKDRTLNPEEPQSTSAAEQPTIIGQTMDRAQS